MTPAIRVLVVGDGPFMQQNPPQLGISFLKDPVTHAYAQDLTDNTFTVSEFIYLMTNSVPSISVDTAHRRNDLNATFPNFTFTNAALAPYDVLWILGYEGRNGSVYGTPIGASEVQAIAEFMAGGGGVFATGDHEGMGSFICGSIPRVRSMRLWFGEASDFPAGYPATSIDSTGAVIASLNWPGLSIGARGRADTLQRNPTDTATEFLFDDQSDDIPQPLAFPGSVVHPILEGETGPLSRFPDHMHEGEVVTPVDLTQVLSINGQDFPEYPVSGSFRPAPAIIATGEVVGGHSTKVEGMSCEQNNFGGDTALTVSRQLGVLCAYDGRAAGVGRVVTDSSFHHYLDVNLIGDPCGTTPDREQGFGPKYVPPAAGTVLADLQAFYVNTVTWLARTNRSFYFAVDKGSFGFDEASDNLTFPVFPNAFWLVVDGYSLTQVLNSVATNAAHFSGPFAGIAGIAIESGPLVGEAGVSPADVQRVAIPYSVRFASGSLTSFPHSPGGTIEMILEATLSIIAGPGQATETFAAETVFELTGGENPYFQNINPSFGNAFYLSQDLSIFTVTPALDAAPVLGVPFHAGQPDAPFDYITRLLSALNSDPNFTVPSSPDPLLTAFPSQFVTSGDSSVTPSTLGLTNYNFAIARVRLNGPANSSAVGVKVFFRLFITQTSDTDYHPTESYLSTVDALGLPAEPLPAPDGETIPFFASSSGAGGDYAPNGPNVQTIDITASDAGAAWAYFGCYLNVYDPSLNLNLFGTHHCIVAQIAYDDAPIVNSNGLTAGPDNSDKLAQRNMQVTFSGNPTSKASHRIPQTFDLRPSPAPSETAGQLLELPDELMIDWGNTPLGSTASIYWPQVRASDVVATARRLYSTDQLATSDPHTVRCAVTAGITYVPIPSGVAANVAGLFTIDLPGTVVKGQEFDIVVRRISSRQVGDRLTIPAAASRADATAAAAANGRVALQRNWRYVVGTFLVKIPVAPEASLRASEENTYAILLWRLGLLSHSSRWFPVLQRYVAYIASRVDGFGGNAGAIEPSPSGAAVPTGHPHPSPRPVPHPPADFTGKVAGITYDRFGDFEGFLLDTEHGHRRAFHATEAKIEALVRLAWIDRVVISVTADDLRPERPVTIVLRRASD
jgi:hypothetical protein